ncbi:MAG: UDP-N-acetylmuramoyl-L-alanyl-D-glutamate--2,6-diaminopimelate ligase, partial [Myxococcota bacterium]
MKLSDLLRDLPGARVLGQPAADLDIAAVHEDSRQVGPGDAFVAMRGLRVDGHDYAGVAAKRGAAVVIVERELALPASVCQVIVADSAHALGVLSARLAGRPGDRLTLIGITGTNGKTTTTFLVEAILAAGEYRPGIIGTVNYRYGGATYPAAYTTPPPAILHGILGDMTDSRCSHAVLEVSSASLAQKRMVGVAFDVAAFSNLTQDHLDLHGSMDNYRAAKALLFAQHLADGGTAVINIDDGAAPQMIAAAGAQTILRVSARPETAPDEAEIRVVSAHSTVAGIRAEIATPRGLLTIESSALIGAYNIANTALAVGIAEALGVPHPVIARGIATMAGVPGRVERVANEHGLDILVDYAHTPDALSNVLAALRPLARRRLICVFGCGGDRDPTKRPIMGAAVSAGAHLAVVTSDNPRTEDPQAIIDMILPAVPDPFYVDSERRTAISAAVAEAVPGDIVLIAGKGHEDYQILGTDKIHFDDREEAARAAAERWDFALSDIIDATGGALLRAPADDPARSQRFARVIIDGRDAAPGDLYVAVR